MGKMNGKKGIFFTFIAITILGVFILLFTPQTEVALESKSDSVKKRIDTLNHYVMDMEGNYYKSVLRASTYKTMLSLIYYMNQTSTYLPNLNSEFSEVMIKGTIGGTKIDTLTGKNIMENNTLTDWTRRIEQIGSDTYNVNTTINLSTVEISQSSPWEIEVTLYFNYTISSEVAQWNTRNRSVKSIISIDGWIDPAYLLQNNGLYVNYIRRSNIEFNQWNVSQLRYHVGNGTYVHWPYSSAPSYLRRFAGPPYIDSNSSCCGIHSVANPVNLIVPDQRASYVDYLLWNQTQFPCSRLYNITYPDGSGPYTGGIWDSFRYFKLDSEHFLRYNITSGNYLQGGC